MDADSVFGEERPTDQQIEVAVQAFQLLSDPTRLRLLWALLHGEESVGRLADLARAQSPAVSQHLAKLRLAGLVRTRREGTRIFYAPTNTHIGRLLHEALYYADHVVQHLPTTTDR